MKRVCSKYNDRIAPGLTTLDSIGVAGTGAHSNREEARASSLVERAQLNAVLIRRLAAE